MDLNTVKSIYRNTEVYADQQVTLGGWIRTMRVSKNFGFIELNDGTFFKNIQIVFEADHLSNYAEITKLGVGAAILVKGQLVETPQAKQPFEVKAEKTPQRRIPAPDCLSAPQNQSVFRDLPGTQPDRVCHPPILPGKRICVYPYAHYHRQRL